MLARVLLQRQALLQLFHDRVQPPVSEFVLLLDAQHEVLPVKADDLRETSQFVQLLDDLSDRVLDLDVFLQQDQVDFLSLMHLLPQMTIQTSFAEFVCEVERHILFVSILENVLPLSNLALNDDEVEAEAVLWLHLLKLNLQIIASQVHFDFEAAAVLLLDLLQSAEAFELATRHYSDLIC